MDPLGDTSTGDDGDRGRPAVRLFAPGTEIGRRYEVRSVLGMGGAAVVYAAWDRDLSRSVALKALRHDRMTDTSLRRFRREVAVAHDADSPRLVRVYDIGEAGGTIFLTMELVDGESLRPRLEAGPLPIAEALRIAREVLLALGDLHRLGVVHRDVKPENVLVSQDGQVKLADFGLARRWEGSDTRATETDTIVGTLAYLAPEQALGRDVDARTDVYAFGVLLFEMLTGTVPFSSPTALGGILARLHEPAPDAARVRPDLPRWLADVIARALEKEPSRRYQTAAECLADLERQRASTVPRVRSRRALLAGTAVAATLLLLAAGLALRQRPSPRLPALAADGPHGAKAVDAKGNVLWRRPDLQAQGPLAVLRLAGRKAPVLATVLRGQDDDGSSGTSRTLVFLDPFSGRVLESHPQDLPAAPFHDFSPTFVATQVAAVDLDGDGAEEVLVVYTHTPYYPAIVMAYYPAAGTSRAVFLHAGHVLFVGAADLDGDGRKEAVFVGPNNRMGWMTGIAAVRVPEAPREGPRPRSWTEALAASPDADYRGSVGPSLLWYALGPTFHSDLTIDPRLAFDPASRLVTIRGGASSLVLTADGFQPGSSGGAAGRGRGAARERAYALLRDALQRDRLGVPADGLALARQALDEATRAGDGPLTGWARRVAARLAITAGRGAEGEAETNAVVEAWPDTAAGAAWDAARAFHLTGDLGRALRWYGWGLSRAKDNGNGRLPYEFLEGQLFALAEQGRWTEAEEAVARYATVFDAATAATYRVFLSVARGHTPGPLASAPGTPDLVRAWALESRLAAAGSGPAGREALEAIAKDAAAELHRVPGTGPLFLSVASEVDRRLGDLPSARAKAQEAWDGLAAARRREPWARAHAPLLAGRMRALGLRP